MQCPVWHPGLTKKLSKDIERVQKRCLKLLFPALSYAESLSKTGPERLDNRRDMITQSMFREINNPKHPLHYLLPPIKVPHSQLSSLTTFFAYIPISTSTLHYYTLWKGFCTILHFQEILVLMVNL